MLLGLLTTSVSALAVGAAAPPICLHPDNPHYFLFRGRPTVLITSGEHYGAVLNLDFQHVPYLDELHRHGLNLTRTFTGVYSEDPQAFGIVRNTLAPAPGRLICPWARTDQPGAGDGGCKFDLTRWDDAYFARLRSFCSLAGQRGVVVEVVLFCPYYGEPQWQLSPLNSRNNVNGVGDVPREEALTLRHSDLVAVQEAMVRRILRELRDFDNVYYEICNEPYFGGVTMEWQHRIADVIVDEESRLGVRHLIAQNIANGCQRIEQPHPAVSLFNFHYASPPDAVTENYHLGKAIGFDETGFQGTADLPYRTDAWHFMLAGGAVYDHLDYSFAVGDEAGTFALPDSQPGGGSAALRAQLAVLKRFLDSFDLVHMAPAPQVVADASGAVVRVLAHEGAAYAVYVYGTQATEIGLEVPPGEYQAQWVNTESGATEGTSTHAHAGGILRLPVPAHAVDIALRLLAQS